MTSAVTLPNTRETTYTLFFARDAVDIQNAQRLRYEVFNLELGEGLNTSHTSGLDQDKFDEVCDHLLVQHVPSRVVVGTYRMQSGKSAGLHHGYYSAQEFDFNPFEPNRHELIELGRACIHAEHRNLTVLNLLWRGLAQYTQQQHARYLIGCSSLTSQNPNIGTTMYANLMRRYLAEPQFFTQPRPGYDCLGEVERDSEVKPPKLLRAYLNLGAKICGPPALDREFKTIDFLTLLDLQKLTRAAQTHFDL
jgi:putative hemolysin